MGWLIRLADKVGGEKAGSDGDSGRIRNWVRSGFAIPASYRTSPRQEGSAGGGQVRRDKLGLFRLRILLRRDKLGLFGFVLALGAPDELKIGFALALFGFVWVRFGFAFGRPKGVGLS